MIQRLAPVAGIAVGAVLFASALQGITRTNTRLAAPPVQITPDRALVEPTRYHCPQLTCATRCKRTARLHAALRNPIGLRDTTPRNPAAADAIWLYRRSCFAGTKRVSDGTRTRGRRDHNPELYQLSYAHQDGPSIAAGSAEFSPDR